MRQLLSDSIRDYAYHRKSLDLSRGTIANDMSTLRSFLTVVGNLYTENLASRHMDQFFAEVAKKSKPQTLGNHHQRLNTFFTWCRHTKRMKRDQDPLYGRRKAKGANREHYRLHVSKFPYLLDVAGERDPRDRALIAVLIYTFMRDREIADLRIADVDLDAGYIMARIHKTRQEDRMPIGVEFDRELRRWLTHYAREVGGLKPSYYLVPARDMVELKHASNGDIVSSDWDYAPTRMVGQVGRVIKPLLAKAGVPVTDGAGRPTWEGAHTLRRSAARAYFDTLNGMGHDQSLRVVQSMLHHSNVARTEQYIGITADRRTRDELIRGRCMYPAVETRGDFKDRGVRSGREDHETAAV